MKTKIFENYATFEAREDKEMNGVDAFHAKVHPDYEADNLRDCYECYRIQNVTRGYNLNNVLD